jgi:transposase
MLEATTEPKLRARSFFRHELAGLEHCVRQLAQDDTMCRQLMSMPGIGAVVALTFRSIQSAVKHRRIGEWGSACEQ